MFDKEEVEIGCTPNNEECYPMGKEQHEYFNKIECRALIGQLKREQPELTDLVRLKIMRNSHDFGIYYEVGAVASLSDEEALEAAWKLQDLLPEQWDKEAIKYLEEMEHPFFYTKIVKLKSA